jgi:predicted anti-sigma-YlaC factor YlaD
VTFTTSPDDLASDPQCDFSLDADIAGIGVRIAAFMQVCVLAFVSLLGVFHCRATGVKELGARLLYTSVSLKMALVVRMCRGSLAPADAAVGAMILDGQNMALSIQLTAKETLASRW